MKDFTNKSIKGGLLPQCVLILILYSRLLIAALFPEREQAYIDTALMKFNISRQDLGFDKKRNIKSPYLLNQVSLVMDDPL